VISEGWQMHLARFPRIKLCHAPTPLEFMPNLTKCLGGPQLWIKRDDCTGIALGGNKNRKLEFLMGDALARGATHVVTQGAVQSNHVRQTAAVCAKLGLKCTALLEHRVATNDSSYFGNGNVLMDHILGITLEERPADTDMQKAIEEVGKRLESDGDVVYLIPGGGSNCIGALGYVQVALELVAQANDLKLQIDRVVHATGSAGTQAGLIAGFEAMNSSIQVLGIGVRHTKEKQETSVFDLTKATAEKLGLKSGVPRNAVEANCDYVGDGYGIPSPGMVEAVRMLAREEGIFLDPVYSGKGMAGLIDLIRKGAFRKDENVIFVHTGGQAGLFGYQSHFAA
jgi:L-cysteate sulfo-lyase